MIHPSLPLSRSCGCCGRGRTRYCTTFLPENTTACVFCGARLFASRCSPPRALVCSRRGWVSPKLSFFFFSFRRPAHRRLTSFCSLCFMNITSQAKVIEVENRMLLSSLAWFTSLFCLLIMVGSCCVKTCRRFAPGGSGDDDAGMRGRGGRRRGGAVRDRRGCGSCSPSGGAAAMCSGSNGAAVAATPTKKSLHWQVHNGAGQGDGGDGDSSLPPELGSWEAASTAERVPRGDERFSPGVSRF